MTTRVLLLVSLDELVDALGATRAELMSLRDREAALVDEIARRTSDLLLSGTLQGAVWGAQVSITCPPSTVQWREVALQLQPPPALISRYTTVHPPKVRIRTFSLTPGENQ